MPIPREESRVYFNVDMHEKDMLQRDAYMHGEHLTVYMRRLVDDAIKQRVAELDAATFRLKTEHVYQGRKINE